mgnify:FL=1
MTPKELLIHKQADKKILTMPEFRNVKKSSKLPKPFDRMKGRRWHTSGQIDVGTNYRVFMFWRDGEELTDSAFMAWLTHLTPSESLYPLCEFHYHPSHKGIHVKLPCKTMLDYTDRQLPQAPELQLETLSNPDPRTAKGRAILVQQFCNACGIRMNDDGDLWN